MSDQAAVFVAASIAYYGEGAYPFALEQVGKAASAGAKDVALSWAKIADGISVPRDN